MCPVLEWAAVSDRGWNKVGIDGSIDVGLIKDWIDRSYDLVVRGLTKKDQKLLEEL